MKNLCKVALLVSLFASFANSEEQERELEPQPPMPLAGDSTLAVNTDSTLAVKPDSTLAIKPDSALTNAKCLEYNPEDYQKNLRVAAYLHPFQLFFGAAYNMLMFTATIEKPLNLSNSVVVQPTVWLGNSAGYIAGVVEYENLKRAGLGVGVRRYIEDKGYGSYLQAIASAYYISAGSISYKEDDGEDDDTYYSPPNINTWTKVKGVVGELMFYVGIVHKWQNISFFYEGGLGFGYDGTDTFQMGYINKLAANFNVGIGIPF